MNASVLQFSLAENLLDMLANTTARRDAPHGWGWLKSLFREGWLGWREPQPWVKDLRAGGEAKGAADAEDALRRDAACSRGALLLGCSTYVPSSPLKVRGRSQWLVQEKRSFQWLRRVAFVLPMGGDRCLLCSMVSSIFYSVFHWKRKSLNHFALQSDAPALRRDSVQTWFFF